MILPLKRPDLNLQFHTLELKSPVGNTGLFNSRIVSRLSGNFRRTYILKTHSLTKISAENQQ
jgi:hypothetical protein